MKICDAHKKDELCALALSQTLLVGLSEAKSEGLKLETGMERIVEKQMLHLLRHLFKYNVE